MKQNSNIPPGHPDIAGGTTQNGPASGPAAAMQPEVQAAIEKAKQSPDDFDAQIKAAEMYYQIERFDDAIALYKRANQLKPDDREIIVHLGNANFDGNHYRRSRKMVFTGALPKRPMTSMFAPTSG